MATLINEFNLDTTIPEKYVVNENVRECLSDGELFIGSSDEKAPDSFSLFQLEEAILKHIIGTQYYADGAVRTIIAGTPVSQSPPEHTFNFPRSINHNQLSVGTPKDKLEVVFDELVNRWKNDTLYISSITEMCTHPDYQKIIGLGEKALPLIFKELKARPDHWFWALKAITHEDPLSDDDRKDFNSMASAWLRYGREKGYI